MGSAPGADGFDQANARTMFAVCSGKRFTNIASFNLREPGVLQTEAQTA